MPEPKPLLITAAALGALLDYSSSLPTGATVGKRWKRNIGSHNQKEWLIGEYYDIGEPDKVGIRWHTPEISDDLAALRRPIEGFLEAAQGLALARLDHMGLNSPSDRAEIEAICQRFLASWQDELTLKVRQQEAAWEAKHPSSPTANEKSP